MPLSRGPGIVLPVPETPVGSHPPIGPEYDPGSYVLTWITPPDRAGNVRRIVLNPPGDEFMTLKQIAGLGVPPRDITTSANPDGGSNIDNVRYASRQIDIPIRTRNRHHMGFLARWRSTGEAFDCTARYGPGTLRLDRPDGSRREIKAMYQAGWEGEPGDGAWLEDTCTVSLLCPDPWFRDPDPKVLERGTETLTDYLSPYPSIGTGQVLGATKLSNPGSVDVWPTWTVTGPMTSLTAVNHTRDQSFTLTYTLAAGQTLTMSSRPIQVRGPAGQNLISALNLPAGKPWRLDAETVSDVTFTAAGANAGTSVALSFYPGYATA